MNSWESHLIFLACLNHEYQRIHYDMVEQCWRQQVSLNTLVSHMVVGHRYQRQGPFIPVWHNLPMLWSPTYVQSLFTCQRSRYWLADVPFWLNHSSTDSTFSQNSSRRSTLPKRKGGKSALKKMGKLLGSAYWRVYLIIYLLSLTILLRI